jgi:hypothetical protein
MAKLDKDDHGVRTSSTLLNGVPGKKFIAGEE